ncbi:hypothetical protein ACP3V5_25785, partial [Vibrio maritimus]
ADVVLPVDVDEAVADRSMVARLLHLALLDALLMTWFRRAGPTALAHLADSDAQLKQQQAYVRSARRSEAAIAHPAPVLPTQR